MKLRTRLALTLATSTLALVTVTGAVLYSAARSQLRGEIDVRLSGVAAHMRSRLDAALRERFHDLRIIASMPPPAGAEALEAMGATLARHRAGRRGYGWIAYADASGHVLAGADRALETVDVSPSRAFIEGMKGPAVGEVQIAPVSDPAGPKPGAGSDRMLSIAYPAPATGAKAVAVVMAGISLGWMQDIAAEVLATDNAAQTTELLLLGPDRTVLLGPAQLVGHAIQDSADYSVAASSSVARADYPGLGWTIVARLPNAIAYSPLDALLRAMLAGGLAVVLGGFLAGFVVARRFAKPMELWAEAADRIGTGDRNIRFPEARGSDELWRLSTALKSMTMRFEHHEEELQARLSERTTALVEATNALETERERLAFALEGSHLALWDLDIATGQIRLSVEWSRMLGEPEGAITIRGAELARLVPNEDHPRILEAMVALFKGTIDRYDLEHRVLRRDGATLWIRSMGSVTRRDAGGRALRATGTNADITARKKDEEHLRKSEEQLRLVTENIPLMINQLDTDCRFRFANRAYLEFLGIELEALIGRRLEEIAGEDAKRLIDSFMPRLQAGEVVHHERDRLDRQGRVRHFELQLVPQRSPDGQFQGFFSLIDDVTERRSVAREIAAAAAELRLITDGVDSLIAHLDLEGRVLFANRRYREFFGLPEDPRGRSVRDFAGGEAHALLMEKEKGVLAGETVAYEREVAMDGRVLHLDIHLVPQRGESGTVEGMYALVNDVTVRKEMQQMLEALAMTDPLTALPNRRLFEDRVDGALARARRGSTGLALLYVDLDDFKRVNDAHGHAAGDLLLRQAAARLLSCVRESDTVARLGGDEFAILLGSVDGQGAAAVRQKVLDAFSLPFDLAGRVEVDVRCSVGVAFFPRDATDRAGLMRVADAGMYAAKGMQA